MQEERSGQSVTLLSTPWGPGSCHPADPEALHRILDTALVDFVDSLFDKIEQLAATKSPGALIHYCVRIVDEVISQQITWLEAVPGLNGLARLLQATTDEIGRGSTTSWISAMWTAHIDYMFWRSQKLIGHLQNALAMVIHELRMTELVVFGAKGDYHRWLLGLVRVLIRLLQTKKTWDAYFLPLIVRESHSFFYRESAILTSGENPCNPGHRDEDKKMRKWWGVVGRETYLDIIVKLRRREEAFWKEMEPCLVGPILQAFYSQMVFPLISNIVRSSMWEHHEDDKGGRESLIKILKEIGGNDMEDRLQASRRKYVRKRMQKIKSVGDLISWRRKTREFVKDSDLSGIKHDISEEKVACYLASLLEKADKSDVCDLCLSAQDYRHYLVRRLLYAYNDYRPRALPQFKAQELSLLEAMAKGSCSSSEVDQMASIIEDFSQPNSWDAEWSRNRDTGGVRVYVRQVKRSYWPQDSLIVVKWVLPAELGFAWDAVLSHAKERIRQTTGTEDLTMSSGNGQPIHLLDGGHVDVRGSFNGRAQIFRVCLRTATVLLLFNRADAMNLPEIESQCLLNPRELADVLRSLVRKNVLVHEQNRYQVNHFYRSAYRDPIERIKAIKGSCTPKSKCRQAQKDAAWFGTRAMVISTMKSCQTALECELPSMVKKRYQGKGKALADSYVYWLDRQYQFSRIIEGLVTEGYIRTVKQGRREMLAYIPGDA